MKKNTLISIFILLSILLAACGAPDQPVEELETSLPDEMIDTTLPDEMLDTIWEWTEIKVTDPEAWSSPIVDPPNYTVFFNSDGFSDVEADCNFVQGQYEVADENLNFSVGAPSYFVCAPESASCTYLILMGQVDSYRLEEGKLILPFGDGAGELIFAAAGGGGFSNVEREPGAPSGPEYPGSPEEPGPTKEPGSPEQPGGPEDPGSKKVVVCHKAGDKNPVTLEISRNALNAHLAHGDSEGPCE
jgi:heat shock protein HslJ